MAGGVEHFDSEIGMDYQLVTGAEAIKKGESFAVTAHHDVLSVVDEIVSGVIREGVGAPTKGGLAFEQCDTEARIREGDPSAQAGQAATYDDDIPPLDRHRISRRGRVAHLPMHGPRDKAYGEQKG
jgi:hypothetical protein